MLIIIGLVVIASSVAIAEYMGVSKSDYALKALWIWSAVSASNLVYDIVGQGHSLANAVGSFAAIFGLPAIIAVFLWRFFKLI
jgi:hypothetical protein